MRCSWDDVWRTTAMEFLNVIAYRRDKDERDRENIERWKKQH